MDERTLRVLAHLDAGVPRLRDTRLVCIDGAAGSGKSTLATAVVAALRDRHDDVTLLHLDHVYRGWDDLAATPARVRRDVLDPLAAGAPGRYRRWDWTTSALAEEHPVPATAYLLIEGVGAGSRALAEHATTVVWLDGDAAVRKARALARDGDTFAPHWTRWAAQEQEVFARERTRERADLVLS